MAVGSSNGRRIADARPISVGIVGAGFGGVGIGIRLKQAGIDDFTILRARRDRRRRLARQHLPGRDLRRALAPLLVLLRPGPQLVAPLRPTGARSLAYMEDIVSDYGIEPHLRLGTEVESRELR